MKNKKSFQDLMKQMSELSEDQQGKLKGGFSAFSASSNAAAVDTSVSVSVTVSHRVVMLMSLRLPGREQLTYGVIGYPNDPYLFQRDSTINNSL